MTSDDPVRDARSSNELIWVSYTCHGCEGGPRDTDGACTVFWEKNPECLLLREAEGYPRWEMEVE